MKWCHDPAHSCRHQQPGGREKKNPTSRDVNRYKKTKQLKSDGFTTLPSRPRRVVEPHEIHHSTSELLGGVGVNISTRSNSFQYIILNCFYYNLSRHLAC